MSAIRPNRVGLVLGMLLGGWHLAWSLLVAIGFAQPLIDFIFWIHFIKPVKERGRLKAITKPDHWQRNAFPLRITH